MFAHAGFSIAGQAGQAVMSGVSGVPPFAAPIDLALVGWLAVALVCGAVLLLAARLDRSRQTSVAVDATAHVAGTADAVRAPGLASPLGLAA